LDGGPATVYWNGSSYAVRLFYALNTASTANDVIHAASSQSSYISASEWTGNASSSPVDVYASNSNATTTGTTGQNMTSNSTTTTVAGDLIIGVGSNDNQANTGTGFTQIAYVGYEVETEYLVQAAASSIAATWNDNTNDDSYGAEMVAFKPAGATVYYTTGFSQPHAVFENGVAMTPAASKAAMTPGSWWWNATNSGVYVEATGKVNPATETIEIQQRSSCVNVTQSYVTIQGVTCQEASAGILINGNYVLVNNDLVQHIRYGPVNNGGGNAVAMYSGSHVTIQNTTITDSDWGINLYPDTGVIGDSNLVQYNTVYDIGSDCIGLGGDTRTHLINHFI
jgi:hypothetical protein